MQKIIVNLYYGGTFCFSKAAILRLRELGCEAAEKVDLKKNKLATGLDYYIQGYKLALARDDRKAVQVVEELGVKAAGEDSLLKIIEIPEGIVWHIENYMDDSEQILSNGSEFVVEGKAPAKRWEAKF
jgi:Fe2+ transport system protein FeoA